MADGYGVNGHDMHQASVDTMQVKDDSTAHINKLRNDLAQLEGVWKGQAYTAFQGLSQRFNTAAENMLRDLQVISEKLAEGAKQYGHQEDQTSQDMNKAGGSFGF
jgi:WXG100 family type VII secretion target